MNCRRGPTSTSPSCRSRPSAWRTGVRDMPRAAAISSSARTLPTGKLAAQDAVAHVLVGALSQPALGPAARVMCARRTLLRVCRRGAARITRFECRGGYEWNSGLNLAMFAFVPIGPIGLSRQRVDRATR